MLTEAQKIAYRMSYGAIRDYAIPRAATAAEGAALRVVLGRLAYALEDGTLENALANGAVLFKDLPAGARFQAIGGKRIFTKLPERRTDTGNGLGVSASIGWNTYREFADWELVMPV